MIYQPINPMSREEAQRMLASTEEADIVDALLSITFHDEDWKWVQQTCLTFLESTREGARQTAAICLGHLARIHGTLDFKIVIPALAKRSVENEMASDPVREALADIYNALRWYPNYDVTGYEFKGSIGDANEHGIAVIFHFKNMPSRICEVIHPDKLLDEMKTLPDSAVCFMTDFSATVLLSPITEESLHEFIDYSIQHELVTSCTVLYE